MSQAQSQKYEISTLLPINQAYNDEHTLNQADVEKVNAMKTIIEFTRSKTKPKSGDRILYTGKHGDYSANALVDGFTDDKLTVCVKPMIPFCGPATNGIYCSTSGGPFAGVYPSELKYVGTTSGDFKVWGHKGSCGNGAVYFRAEVSLWEYTEPEALYGNFSTKDWVKHHFHKSEMPVSDGYLYKGNGFSIDSEEEFQNFLNQFCGTVFPGHWKNSYVVWTYRDEPKGVSPEEWAAMDAPVSIRTHRCRPMDVKIIKDFDKHIVYSYYPNPQI